jgi:hypothetical protein
MLSSCTCPRFMFILTDYPGFELPIVDFALTGMKDPHRGLQAPLCQHHEDVQRQAKSMCQRLRTLTFGRSKVNLRLIVLQCSSGRNHISVVVAVQRCLSRVSMAYISTGSDRRSPQISAPQDGYLAMISCHPLRRNFRKITHVSSCISA